MIHDFFATHPVFTYGEFSGYLVRRESRNPKTHKAIILHHLRAGRIIRIRRGLYASIPPGLTPETAHPDPFLVASRMAPNAVIAYHTALEFHGRAYSAFHEFTILAETAMRPFDFQGNSYRAVSFPKALVRQGQQQTEIITSDRSGLPVLVTTLERALVDVLDRPDLSGGWEEIWRSLESVEYFDLDRVVEYCLLLGNATTIAKVGFFLEQHAAALMIDDAVIEKLRAHKPGPPHYMLRTKRESGRLVDAWNLVIPISIIDRTWGAVT